MREKFEPFKELLKALREIKYAIDGRGKNNNSEEGNENNIVLPKYIFAGYHYHSSPFVPSAPGISESVPSESVPSESVPSESVPSESDPSETPSASLSTDYKVFEIDYDGKIIKMSKEEVNNLSEEELTNWELYVENHTTNNIYADPTKIWNDDPAYYLYTKQQIDTINKNSIVQLYEGTITKLDDNVIIDIVELVDMLGTGELNNIQTEQYYGIMLKRTYDNYTNPIDFGEDVSM